MKFLNYIKVLLSDSNAASIRRFIALMLIIPYIIGIFVGVFANQFDFYITAMIAGALPILLAYFTLTWEHVVEISKSLKDIFKKKSPFDELTDP